MASSALPKPTLSFTIPSQQDAIRLQCRVYHPEFTAQLNSWKPKAVIVAHPYAPLGGCMDDHVVGLIASICLREGFILGTFNFRGAGESKGSTSWQSKCEQNDYMSFIGFMTYYLHYLCSSSLLIEPSLDQLESDIGRFSYLQYPDTWVHRPHKYQSCRSSSEIQNDGESYSQMRLLLAGYSYGALITLSLPPTIHCILAPFEAPMAHSNYAKIRYKAKKLADQQTRIYSAWANSHYYLGIHHPKTCSKETAFFTEMSASTEAQLRENKSRKRRNSTSFDVERLRESFDVIDSKIRPKYSLPQRARSNESSLFPMTYTSQAFGHSKALNEYDKLEETLQETIKIGNSIDVAYLLVSPLQGIVCDLLTMWSFKPWKQKNLFTETDVKLKLHPTLAIYGEGDMYVSAKSIRNWAEKLAVSENEQEISQFKYIEIAGAGHFWDNYLSATSLQAEIRNFIHKL